jgi:splicing factor 3B subunit 3
VSGLPMNPSAVWTVKRATRDEHDKYIVVSFPNSTLVLAVGETVEEVHDSGFLCTTSTLVATNVGEDGLLQVIFHSAPSLLFSLFSPHTSFVYS